jgi:hypothetical protein
MTAKSVLHGLQSRSRLPDGARAVLRSALPADARPAPVVSLQRVAFAAWARGPTLLSLAADGWLCFYRRACGPLLGAPLALRARNASRYSSAACALVSIWRRATPGRLSLGAH